MIVAVTGGAGQLGTVIIRKLLTDRAIKTIRCLDLRAPALASFRIEPRTVDIRDPQLAAQLEGCDAVFHLAFVVAGYRPRAEYDAINIEGSKNVFRAAAAAGVRRIVYASSIAAYGLVKGHPTPILESTPRRFQPEFAYSACKYQVEDFLDAFEREHPEIAIVRLRPGILMGAHMENPLGQILRKNLIPDSGAAPLPMVWDEDVADAAMLAFRQHARGAFNLVAGEPISTKDAAHAAGLRRLPIPLPIAKAMARASFTLAKARGRKPKIDPTWLDGADIAMVVSSERARTELGWKPRFSTGREVIVHHTATVPQRLDRRLELFFRLAQAGARRARIPEEARRMHAEIHLDITGPRGGDVSITMHDGRMTFGRDRPRPPTSVIRVDAHDLLALLGGVEDFATASMTGKIRVEGEPSAGLLVQGLLATFRAATEKPGVPGLVAKNLARLFAAAAGPKPQGAQS